MEEKKIKLNVLGITFSQIQAGAYALVLAEDEGLRRVPIIIGTPEAQSIAIFLEGLHPPRPLTHDLFITFAKALHIELQEVNIYKFEDGVFYSELLFRNKNEIVRIDSRTSDAIALALRTQSPIYTTENIMKEASIIMDEETDEEEGADDATEDNNENRSIEELQSSLDNAIRMEDYEKASHIRDLIQKKKDSEG